MDGYYLFQDLFIDSLERNDLSSKIGKINAIQSYAYKSTDTIE